MVVLAAFPLTGESPRVEEPEGMHWERVLDGKSVYDQLDRELREAALQTLDGLAGFPCNPAAQKTRGIGDDGTEPGNGPTSAQVRGKVSMHAWHSVAFDQIGVCQYGQRVACRG